MVLLLHEFSPFGGGPGSNTHDKQALMILNHILKATRFVETLCDIYSVT